MPGVVIRPATEADHDALVEQFQGLNAVEDGISHDRDASRAGAEASLAASARRVAETGGHRLVAVLDGAVVGHLFLAFPQQPIYVRPELRAHGYVSELFVREARRGAGIGSALLAEAERLTRARGLDRMLIGVIAGNDGAEALYRRSGFAPYALTLLKPL
jgi:GNAT superfamily N-acetyltransferase